ncbi:three-Cys-motif partner protein TcmP [Cohnella zeiphila]|uniref:Three-Cys-motif partner protein TcmP n=1 Tax=Cohnella zeiphila TaxID=2761120 RepID=A0A7X0SMM8_9BACL|nr:three-Cys-motif partner protein TcmP [Cohnella zeiphila]MBB6732808.1 three-Cys-motif partner protein TcmP [Cohnella zeiphila]
MTGEFFEELQKHSDAKLRILNNYVIPWMRKIVLGTQFFGGKCLVIDGFAGAGIYDDGSDGSPMILLKNAVDFYEQARQHGWPEPNIFLIFIEGNYANYRSLKSNINKVIGIDVESDLKEKFFFASEKYPTINVACLNEEIQYVLQTLLGSVSSLIPSFCFIDPFGFSQTPFELIKAFMKNERAEILLNFIYEETNRFIRAKDPKVQLHISRHFGVDDLADLQSFLADKSPVVRKQIIVSFYASQLRVEAGAKHVQSFEIMKNGRTKLVLFFATKSDVGLDVMKKAMWGIDDTGSYLYDDRRQGNQIEFDFFSDLRHAENVEKLTAEIYNEFSGRDKVTKEMIEHFVVVSTNFPTGKLVTAALKKLENGRLIMDVKKKDGSNRRPGTFKDVYINFI